MPILFHFLRLLSALFDLVSYGGIVAVTSFNIVNNMALDTRFKKSLYSCLNTVLPAFEKLLVKLYPWFNTVSLGTPIKYYLHAK